MVAFTIFWRPIHRYGLAYAVALMIVMIWLWRLWNKAPMLVQYPQFTALLRDHADSLLTWLVIGMMMGWRIGHIVFYSWSYYRDHPSQIFAVWEWGMSYFWGIIGVVIAFLLYAWKHGWSWSLFGMVVDSVCAIVPVGSLIGRRGNFVNQELVGRPWIDVFGPHTLDSALQYWLAWVYPLVDAIPRINTHLVASMTEWVVLLILCQYCWRSQWYQGHPRPWQTTRWYLISYMIVRFCLEYLRQDSFDERWLWSLSITQWIIVGGLCMVASRYVYEKTIMSVRR
jgi:phosphatidylglycerol:prolipoprotein diacylglycerol transferase